MKFKDYLELREGKLAFNTRPEGTKTKMPSKIQGPEYDVSLTFDKSLDDNENYFLPNFARKIKAFHYYFLTAKAEWNNTRNWYSKDQQSSSNPPVAKGARVGALKSLVGRKDQAPGRGPWSFAELLNDAIDHLAFIHNCAKSLAWDANNYFEMVINQKLIPTLNKILSWEPENDLGHIREDILQKIKKSTERIIRFLKAFMKVSPNLDSLPKADALKSIYGPAV